MTYELKLTEHEMQIINLLILKAPVPREVTEPLIQSINRQITDASDEPGRDEA